MRPLFVFALLSFAACGTTVQECSPDTCASGCCDATGVCRTSSERTCGRGGQACVACLASQTCNLGLCIGFGGPIEPSVGGGSPFFDAGATGGGSAFFDAGASAAGGASDAGATGGGSVGDAGSGSGSGGGAAGGTGSGSGGGAAGGTGSGGGGACVPENDLTFCRRLAKTCGSVVDFDNCGNSRVVASCGSCGPGSACSASNVCACLPGFNFCQGQCRAEDATMCGASCAVCPTPPGGSPQCVSGMCQSNCPSGSHLCGSSCVSNTSTSSCGNGCTPCPVPANGIATCNGQACGLACNGGFHDCSGQCVSNSAVTSCGSSCTPCQAPANATPTCNGTSCGFTCNPGFHLCGGACVPDTSTSACGASCQTCTAPQGGTATCSSGSCGFTCNAGYCAQGSSCVRFLESPLPSDTAQVLVSANGTLRLIDLSGSSITERTSVDGISWAPTQTLFTFSGSLFGALFEAAIDPLTQAPAVVVSTSSGVQYVSKSGTTYTSSTVWTKPASGAYVRFVSLAFDAQGTPHVVYTLVDSGGGTAKYTRRSGSTWLAAESAGFPNDDADHDLVVSGSTVHLCYWQSNQTSPPTLTYARRSTSWTQEPVATATSFTYHSGCSLGLGSGTTMLTYVLVGPSQHTVKLSTKTTSWSHSTIESASPYRVAAMAMVGGRPVVGFSDASQQPVHLDTGVRNGLGGAGAILSVHAAPSGLTYMVVARGSNRTLARSCGP